MSDVLSIEDINRARLALAICEKLQPFTLHPAAEHDFRCLLARLEWRNNYHLERLARRIIGIAKNEIQ